jgi:hypothetical protein
LLLRATPLVSLQRRKNMLLIVGLVVVLALLGFLVMQKRKAAN